MPLKFRGELFSCATRERREYCEFGKMPLYLRVKNDDFFV